MSSGQTTLLPANNQPTKLSGLSNLPRRSSKVMFHDPFNISVSFSERIPACDSMIMSMTTDSLVMSIAREVADYKHLRAAEHKKRHSIDFTQTVQEEIDDKFARDIFKHLRVAEIKKRPSTDYMKTVQTEIDVDMRATLVEWLVETVEQFELVPEVLYLAVNYMDRYLSGNNIKYNRLQLLAATCFLIAAKHEERQRAPCVRDLCHLTGNRYSKEDVLQMEAGVLEYLKFEVTDPTAKSFLRGLIHIARGPPQLEFLADYIAELSVLEYRMLRYLPSLIAAASLFLAKFILQPAAHPWNATLSQYSLYHPFQLGECVEDLHKLFGYGTTSNFPAVREKYSKLKYMFVARKYCAPWIPSEFFLNPRN